MLKQAPDTRLLDHLTLNRASHIICAKPEVSTLRHKDEVDALRVEGFRFESQLALALGVNCVLILYSLDRRNDHLLASCVRLLLIGIHLNNRLVKLEDLSVDVDMVLARPVYTRVLSADTILNNKSVGRA